MNPQYRIAQVEAATWQLTLTSGSGDVSFLGNFTSESDAVAAMNALITRANWVAPPAKVFDATGAPISQPLA